MVVTVRLYATLRELGVPPGLVRVVFVGGVARDTSYVVEPGDEIGVFPPIGGGV